MCKCDFCGADAKYDGKTKCGLWAYMCEKCFKHYGVNIKGLFSEVNLAQSKDRQNK